MRIEIDASLLVKLFERWAANHPTPDEQIILMPDSRIQGITPRELAKNLSQGTELGKNWLANLSETIVETVVADKLRKYDEKK